MKWIILHLYGLCKSYAQFPVTTSIFYMILQNDLQTEPIPFLYALMMGERSSDSSIHFWWKPATRVNQIKTLLAKPPDKTQGHTVAHHDLCFRIHFLQLASTHNVFKPAVLEHWSHFFVDHNVLKVLQGRVLPNLLLERQHVLVYRAWGYMKQSSASDALILPLCK